MGINFNELPNDAGFKIPDEGTYKAKIKSAEMKQGKDTSKPPYLNLCFELTTKDGDPAGKLYDIIAESDHQIVQFKLRRFVEALKLPITGEFELVDLTKVIIGKELILDVAHDKKASPVRAQVDVFKGACYYSLDDAAAAFGEEIVINETPEVNATDAEDSEY